MEYFKLLRQLDPEKRKVEYYCDDQGNIYSKLLSTGEMRPVRPSISNAGYLIIQRLKGYTVHRAVYEAVTQNPIPDGLIIDHVNNVKTDNRFCNLQILTQKDNVKKSKDVSVDMLDLQGKFLRTFPSMTDATIWLQENGFPKAYNSSICRACKGNLTKVYKHRWRYHNG